MAKDLRPVRAVCANLSISSDELVRAFRLDDPPGWWLGDITRHGAFAQLGLRTADIVRRVNDQASWGVEHLADELQVSTTLTLDLTRDLRPTEQRVHVVDCPPVPPRAPAHLPRLPVRPICEWLVDDLNAVSGLPRRTQFLLHRGPDGQFDGYRALGVGLDTPQHLAGLRTGDLITAVNGLPTNGIASAFKAMEAIEGPWVEISLTRRGQPWVLPIRVVDCDDHP